MTKQIKVYIMDATNGCEEAMLDSIEYNTLLKFQHKIFSQLRCSFDYLKSRYNL